MSESLSLHEARRAALAAQGFDRPRPKGKVRLEHVRQVIHQLGLIQIDYVNVLVPAHYLVLFSRLGGYERALLDELIYRRREFTEHWAHEASIVPMESWPLLEYRRQTHRVRPWGFEKFLDDQAEYVAAVLEHVRDRGASTADDLPPPEGGNRKIPGSWSVTVARGVLEAHFGRGLLAVADRKKNFARAFDLAERLIPAEQHSRDVEATEAQRELLLIAARAYGVASAADLADYFRMPLRNARTRIGELVEAKALIEIQVEGWRMQAYFYPGSAIPKKASAARLISPFDPLVWYRPRVKRLFDFDYRIEIYVPKPQRRWGYYVLPFLLGDRLVARVDLKADRTAGQLAVLGALLEEHADREEVAEPLAHELAAMARWLNLDSVRVSARGSFAARLRAVVKKGSGKAAASSRV